MRYKCKKCQGRELEFSIIGTVPTDKDGEIQWNCVENVELDQIDTDRVAYCHNCKDRVDVEAEDE